MIKDFGENPVAFDTAVAGVSFKKVLLDRLRTRTSLYRSSQVQAGRVVFGHQIPKVVYFGFIQACVRRQENEN
jgi:hypothetical protein